MPSNRTHLAWPGTQVAGYRRFERYVGCDDATGRSGAAPDRPSQWRVSEPLQRGCDCPSRRTPRGPAGSGRAAPGAHAAARTPARSRRIHGRCRRRRRRRSSRPADRRARRTANTRCCDRGSSCRSGWRTGRSRSSRAARGFSVKQMGRRRAAQHLSRWRDDQRHLDVACREMAHEVAHRALEPPNP